MKMAMQLRAEFEAGTLDPKHFGHREHIQLGWLYIKEYPLLQAMELFTGSLKSYVARVGATEKYSETITWFFLCLIAQRQAKGAFGTYEAFVEANADLLCNARQLLKDHYKDETLKGGLARQHFILPDNIQRLS